MATVALIPSLPNDSTPTAETLPMNHGAETRVIITGGAGFIGSALVRHLITATDWRVWNVDKLTYAGHSESLREVHDSPRYRFVHADVCDAHAMAGLFAEARPTAVMHLAAESHVDRSIDGPAVFIRTNIEGTYTLLEAARDYLDKVPADERDTFRFHQVSTDEVYGNLLSDTLFNEASPYDPHNPYAASKAAADHLVRAWHHTYGLPVLLTTCSNNYGPFQFPEKLIPLVILNALEAKPLPIYGRGDNVRDWLHVDDHARALRLVAQKGEIGETYVLGGRQERTNLEVVESVCDAVQELKPRPHGHYRDLIEFVADRPGHDKRYAIDPRKVEVALGWRAEIDFRSGIRDTVRWYLENRWWWEPIRERTYSGERLGLKRSARG